MVLPKEPVSVPLLLGEKMNKFECKVCGEKCIIIIPDDIIDPEYCPVDARHAKWRRVVRIEVVSNGMA